MLGWPPPPLLRRFLRVSWSIRGTSPGPSSSTSESHNSRQIQWLFWVLVWLSMLTPHPVCINPHSWRVVQHLRCLGGSSGEVGLSVGKSGVALGSVSGLAFGRRASVANYRYPIQNPPLPLTLPFSFAIAYVLPGAGILALRCRSGAFWPMQNATSFVAMQMWWDEDIGIRRFVSARCLLYAKESRR
jgi:hypothetical protein